MISITTKFKRSNLTESRHEVKALITNENGKELLISGDKNEYIYPRSSIKIFQAIPFIKSFAYKHYKLNDKQIALACSSHRGENFHIKELKNWIKKIGINKKSLMCGIHYPLNSKANEKLLRSNMRANELHNNCAGKHLAMLTTCLFNKFSTENYLDFNHPHQLAIRRVFESFSNKKIKQKNFGIDGCSAPQYSFRIADLSNMLNNLLKSYNKEFHHNSETQILIDAIINNPNYIGGTDSLDSKVMNICKKKIFCKGGAEGVFLFVSLKKRISGIIKVSDGNERAIPSIIYNIFKKFQIMSVKELEELKNTFSFKLVNHAKITIGSIETKL